MLLKKEIIEKLKRMANDFEKKKEKAESGAYIHEGTPTAVYENGKAEAYSCALEQVKGLLKEVG